MPASSTTSSTTKISHKLIIKPTAPPSERVTAMTTRTTTHKTLSSPASSQGSQGSQDSSQPDRSVRPREGSLTQQADSRSPPRGNGSAPQAGFAGNYDFPPLPPPSLLIQDLGNGSSMDSSGSSSEPIPPPVDLLLDVDGAKGGQRGAAGVGSHEDVSQSSSASSSGAGTLNRNREHETHRDVPEEIVVRPAVIFKDGAAKKDD